VVLDVGCGVGSLLAEARVGAPDAVLRGCDLSFGLCQRTALRNPGIPVVQADGEALPFRGGAFDWVFLTEVLEHLVDPAQALHEVRRVLRPGGSLLVSVPNRGWLRYAEEWARRVPYQPVDDHWFTLAELRELAGAAGFVLTRAQGAENLYFGGGLPRALERIAILFLPALRLRMKRLIVVFRSHR
jgi:SAM-dependent methyltransferase